MTDNEAPRVRVDYESGEKVYLQIARAIRDRIISGDLPVGAQIPSGNQIKQEWGVNRLTGAQAVTPVLIVTRADGSVEPYNAAVTVMTTETEGA